MPVVKGSLRHEWSVLDGFDQVTYSTLSVGNVELVGFSNNPDFFGQGFDPGSLDLSKILGVKYDQQAAVGMVPVVWGDG